MSLPSSVQRKNESSHLAYRPDIDGLRAVAVLLVLAYHAGFAKVRGGFVGVDVFFVISGYLISSVILSELDRSKFSLSNFYQRRIRRILPALFAMLLAAFVLAYKFLLPSEFVDFANSGLAAVFSVSNVYFWQQSGYFDAPAALKPLLHTWSLGVEEQFYIALPLLLMCAHRFLRARLKLAVIALSIVSFAVSAYGAYRDQAATFYLVHTRAWELLLGTMLALDIFPKLSSVISRNVATAAGLVMIVISGLLFSVTTPFPGMAALLPCVGAALLIAGGETGDSIVGRGLSLRPVVFIGAISYSLYLWHWPIIVLHNIAPLPLGRLPSSVQKLVICALSILIAWLSWKFVETPFRAGRFKFSGAPAFRFAFASIVFVTILSAATIAFHGFPSRFPPEAVRVANFLQAPDTYREGVCFISSKYSFAQFDPATCLKSDPTKENYLLIGDSHAAHLWFGLSAGFPNINLMQATASGCKPTIEQPGPAEERCRQLMNYMFSDYLPAHHVDTLLIAGRWEADDLPRLKKTIAWTKQHGFRVILFGPMLQYDAPLPRLLAASIRDNNPAEPASHKVAKYQRLDDQLAALSQNDWKVTYVSFFKMLCPESSCVEYTADRSPLQSDYGHLTREGSVYVAQLLKRDRELP